MGTFYNFSSGTINLEVTNTKIAVKINFLMIRAPVGPIRKIIKQKWNKFLLILKVVALKQQISKFILKF